MAEFQRFRPAAKALCGRVRQCYDAPPGGGDSYWLSNTQAPMLTGTIKFFNKSKGFGFITADTGGKEVFLPSATVTASGLKKVEPGLRVSFEEEADVKGPKAVALTLLDEPRRVPAPPPVPSTPVSAPQPRASAAGATLYGDPTSPRFEAVAAALAAQGLEVAAVDLAVTPPEPLELKKWSVALSGAAVGLVRRSDPMFFALQLDDRFLSENDFWLAISQHPTLINGPVVKAGGKLAICKNAQDVHRLLGVAGGDAEQKPKGLSARLSALLRGEALPPEEEDDEDDVDIEDVVAAAPALVKTEAKAKKDAVKIAAKKPEAAPAKKKVAAAKKPVAKPKKR